MSRKSTEYKQCMSILQELHKKYPSYNLGRHISTALADYGDTWGISDKEFLYALEKYSMELENNVASDYDVEKIIKDAQNLSLDNLYEDEEEDGY